MLNVREIGRLTGGRKAIAGIIAAIMLFGMIFSVGFTYFYVTTNDQIKAEENLVQQSALQSQQETNQANLLVFGTVLSNYLEFYVNNTGPAEAIAAYWVLNGTNAQQELYENSSEVCHEISGVSTCTAVNDHPAIFPMALGQGQSTKAIDTNISVTSISATFVIKVVTLTGVIALGAYPNEYTSSSSLESDVASGIGSALISFNTFYWYDYVSGPAQWDSDGDFSNICALNVQCDGGSWIFNASNPHPGSLVPEGQNHTNDGCSYCGIEDPIVFSVNVTNEDTQEADLVINSQANLWIMETCDAGTPTSHCGETSPVYVFYVVNVNPTTGQILSTTKGSFAQINIPYGVTKTLYFASAYPISLDNFQYMTLGTDDSTIPGNNLAYYGQFAIFMLLPGTRLPPDQVLIYGQNIPFESTIAGDNIGWYTETPATCSGGSTQPFQLTVNDSYFSGADIDQVVLNASTFSNVAPSAPTGWSESVSNGIITWTNTNNNDLIGPGQNENFYWVGTAPTLNTAEQEIFPITIYWNSGALTALQGAAACFVNPGSPYPVPKVQPTGILDYVPITLSNEQTSAVSGGTPVQLDLPWSAYSSYLDNPVNNVLFFDWSGNSLNAWIESGTASSSTSTVWVKLNSSGIAPLSSITIYMGFYATGTNHLSSSGPFGEAPQLSTTYGQYDDGSTVFSAYFNGNTPTADFSVHSGLAVAQATGVAGPGGTTISAIQISGTTNAHAPAFVFNTALSNVAMITESSFALTQTNDGTGVVGLLNAATVSGSNNGISAGMGFDSYYFFQAYDIAGTVTEPSNGAGTSPASGTWTYGSVTYTGTSATSWTAYDAPQLYSTTGGYSGTVTNNPLSGASNIYLGAIGGSSAVNYYINWARARLYPPNGVMPSVIYGPVFP